MPFELFSDVILLTDLPEEDLRAGDVGTVVDRHSLPGLEDGYSVEFFNMTGETVAIVTVPASLLRSPTPAGRESDGDRGLNGLKSSSSRQTERASP